MPKVILLDALGTLIALKPPAPRLRDELARRFDVEVTEDDAARAIGSEIAYYRAHLDEGRDDSSLAALRLRCGGVVRDALPPSPAIASASLEAITDALLASLEFEAFGDAAPALATARGRGQRLVVVSNWDISLHEVLATARLGPLLDGVITSAEAGARKPAREIFAAALRIAGASPGEAVHVGDSIEEDVAGARASGIEPVLLCRAGLAGLARLAGTRTIATLAQLAPEGGTALT